MKKTVRTDLRQMQDEWFSKQAGIIQSYADSKDMKNFCSALKAVYGPTSSGSAPLLSADGTTLISDKEKLLERWAEHFDTVLNRPSTINEEAINRLPKSLSMSLSQIPQQKKRSPKPSSDCPVVKHLVLIRSLLRFTLLAASN